MPSMAAFFIRACNAVDAWHGGVLIIATPSMPGMAAC
jgi:hypothetical protein